jgi:peroxiredoxin
MQSEFGKLTEQGGTLVAISADPSEDVLNMARRYNLTFTLVGDTERAMLHPFQTLHENAVPGRDAARPAAFFVRADGTLAHMIAPENYRERLSPEALHKGFAKTAP